MELSRMASGVRAALVWDSTSKHRAVASPLNATECEMALPFHHVLDQKGPFHSYGTRLVGKGLIGPSRAGVGAWM